MYLQQDLVRQFIEAASDHLVAFCREEADGGGVHLGAAAALEGVGVSDEDARLGPAGVAPDGLVLLPERDLWRLEPAESAHWYSFQVGEYEHGAVWYAGAETGDGPERPWG